MLNELIAKNSPQKLPNFVGNRKSTKFGDMIEMIKLAQEREKMTNLILHSSLIASLNNPRDDLNKTKSQFSHKQP